MTEQQKNNINLINLCHAIGDPAIMRGVAIHMREIGYADHADHLDRIADTADKVMEDYIGKMLAG